MSKKRILPALILAGSVGFLGVHRIYAGRYVTGLVQFGLFVVGAVMLCRSMSGLESLQTIDDVEVWAMNHPVQPFPVLLVAIPSFWALFDCATLLRRKFRDGAGEMMTRWV